MYTMCPSNKQAKKEEKFTRLDSPSIADGIKHFSKQEIIRVESGYT